MTGSQRVIQLSIAAGLLATLCFGQDEPGSSGGDCTFRSNPDDFLARENRARSDVFQRMAKLGKLLPRNASVKPVAPSELPRNNFIDVAIFDKMAKDGVPSAPLSTDEEFYRRISLDLTGRAPSADETRAFLENPATDKRRATIDRLLYSPEFVDKWTMWLGDLLQINQQAAAVSRGVAARNTYYNYARVAIYENRSLKDIAYELVTGKGNSAVIEQAQANFANGAYIGNGPVQDTYDNLFYRTASSFLGMGQYDCILCHDGRRHLDQLSLWGRDAIRLDAYKMAAFFSRVTVTIGREVGGATVTDRSTGTYDLNTNSGNRPGRTAIGSLRNITPEYHFTGARPASNDWRGSFADNMVNDPMLGINFANRLWKAMFNMGLVEPIDSLDPSRLDPAKPPDAPWGLQATHPELLQELAKSMRESNYNLREFLRQIAESSAYQLSSRYDETWKVEYVPYFARRYARRLEGEEVHDGVVKSTGVVTRFMLNGFTEPIDWAMKMPEPMEPRNFNGNNYGEQLNFMNTFYRGNRDTLQRNQSGSILQQLFLMNNSFVYNRLRVQNSTRLQDIARLTNNNHIVDELFLNFLARRPTEAERAISLAHLQPATSANAKNTAVEDLAWALVNKLEYLFSY